MTKEKNSGFRPIYIVGNSRSGTTLMSNILRKNDNIFMFGELHFFEQFWSPKDGFDIISRKEAEYLCACLLRIQTSGYLSEGNLTRYMNEAKAVISGINDDKLASITVYKAFLKYFTYRDAKIFPAEQTPQYVFYIRELLKFFPKARIIVMIRDPRDVIASQKNKWKIRILRKGSMSFKESIRLWANYHPITTSKLWNSSVRASEKFSDNTQILFVRFEDLITEPEKKIIEICDFLGVEFNSGMMHMPHMASSFGNKKQKGFNRETIGRWRNALMPEEVLWCQRINKEQMKHYSYNLSYISPNGFSVILSLILFPLKLALAFILNINRHSSLLNSIKRRLV